MAETSRRRLALVALLCGVGLVLASVLAGPAGVLCLWLAQPAFAVAVRHGIGQPLPTVVLRRYLPLMLALWLLALALLALATGWPLARLADGGGLGSVLLVSGGVSVLALLLWRSWPVWQALQREGGPLSARRTQRVRLVPATGPSRRQRFDGWLLLPQQRRHRGAGVPRSGSQQSGHP